jgi:hypothetical protein
LDVHHAFGAAEYLEMHSIRKELAAM